MSCRTRTIGTLADRRLIVLTDVSDRRRAMDEIESRNRDLALANENLNQFAFVASHDLQGAAPEDPAVQRLPRTRTTGTR